MRRRSRRGRGLEDRTWAATDQGAQAAPQSFRKEHRPAGTLTGPHFGLLAFKTVREHTWAFSASGGVVTATTGNPEAPSERASDWWSESWAEKRHSHPLHCPLPCLPLSSGTCEETDPGFT